MTDLDEHIGRVERYGFVRSNFPLSYNSHRLDILCNDAHPTEDGRVLYDLTLFCRDCKLENGISGRFADDCDDQMAAVVNAKIAVFDRFTYSECE